jgi:hypothetical protein
MLFMINKNVDFCFKESNIDVVFQGFELIKEVLLE